jgi:uncharacterized caspase-like protein
MQETAVVANELEELQRRFEEYRNLRPSRGRLPPALWKEAAEAARRYGLNPTAQALRLDYHGLKKRMAAAPAPTEQRKQVHAPPAFVELMAPTGEATTDCHVEVESNAVPSYHETLARMPSAA